ncbi:hypothetical protein REMIM1_CH01070 [Rhizobium etli bv. mimosae str. Mim1]|nr:hypothetical protein REMIM1_CH01070 [Rhizobium etli bv. mimosae str. Mim1]
MLILRQCAVVQIVLTLSDQKYSAGSGTTDFADRKYYGPCGGAYNTAMHFDTLRGPLQSKPGRVVAQLYGQAGRSISRTVSANPPADLPGKSARLWNRRTLLSLRRGEAVRPVGRPGSEAIGSDVPGGMPIANRLCPDENLLRQNASS